VAAGEDDCVVDEESVAIADCPASSSPNGYSHSLSQGDTQTKPV
jgi:hypothetical protein